MLAENALLAIALAAEIAYPLLNSKLGLPEEFRWVSQAAVLGLIAIALPRTLQLRSFPVVLLILAGWLLFSTVQALTNGQSAGAVIWGFYTWLRYPLLGLYALTRPRPLTSSDHAYPLVISLVALNLLIQLVQFAAGERPGDNLAGFWGPYGTSQMVSFAALALAVGLGKWIVQGFSKRFLFLMGICVLSSVLGEVKLFPAVVVLMGMLAIIAYTYRRGRILSGLAIVVLVIAASVGFVRLYDLILRPAVSVTQYLDYHNLIRYFSYSSGGPNDVNYVGRLVQLRFVWREIGGSPLTLLLGQGIGSMETSRSLGTAGISLLTGNLGIFGANGLAKLVGDFGALGALAWCFFFAGVASRLMAARTGPGQEAINMALVIYICTLPLWMFYMDIWTAPVTMLLFWLGLGQSLQVAGSVVVPGIKAARPTSYPMGVA